MPTRPSDKMPRLFIAVLVVICLIIIVGGFLLYRSQRNKLRYEKSNELTAIILLKTEDIAKWRRAHLRDGNIIQGIVSANILNSGNLNEDAFIKGVLKSLETFTFNYDYHSIQYFNSDGKGKIIYPYSDTVLFDSLMVQTEMKTVNKKVFISYLYEADDAGRILINVLVPLTSATQEKMGTIILRIDPSLSLFPLIQSWPTPSKSSETLLLRAEGDSVLFLNELRHMKNTALKLKRSIGEGSLPAARAVKGEEGFFEGIDYRGVDVISVLKQVPDSPWSMVAKVDKKEIYSPLREQVILISLIVFLLILSVSLMFIYYWKMQNIQFYQQLNDTKDSFFLIMSHDLRSPFTSIIGFSELLVDEVNKKEFENAGKYAKIIYNSSLNAVSLLNNLTDWSRLQTNRLEMKLNNIELISLIDEEVERLNSPALKKNIKLTRTSPVEQHITADTNMIGTVVRNLISNAIKFSVPGSEIFINVISKPEEVLVEVKDHGIGISKDDLEKLFRIDENISTRGTLNEDGTGLGLILCKEFIARHGGQIRAESEPGKGSTFSFTLPVV